MHLKVLTFGDFVHIFFKDCMSIAYTVRFLVLTCEISANYDVECLFCCRSSAHTIISTKKSKFCESYELYRLEGVSFYRLNSYLC